MLKQKNSIMLTEAKLVKLYQHFYMEKQDIREISNDIKITSNCDWYEFGERSNKLFLTIEKHRATQNIVRKVLSNKP